MKRYILPIFILLITGIMAQEKATLNTPIINSTTISTFEISSILLERGPSAPTGWHLLIKYTDNLGNVFNDEHFETDAETLIKALNKADLSVKSLERRALEHLVAEGKIPASSITGIPFN